MTESLFDRSNRAVTLAVIATVGIIAYNNLAVSAALPEVGNDLGDVALLPWTISIELLTSGVAVLIAGPIVDSLGPRRVFHWSVIAFMGTSILCAAAPTMLALVVARAFQGGAAGILFTAQLTTIGLAYSAELRPRAFAVVSTVWGVMSVAGPTFAATVVTGTGWRGVFLLNVIVAGTAAALAWRVLPGRNPDAETHRTDVLGIALVTIIATAALTTFEGPRWLTIAGVAVTVVGLPAYVRHARRADRPVMRIDHLANRRYRPIHMTSTLVVGAAIGSFAFLPVYMRGGRGTSLTAAAFSIVFHSVAWSLSAFTAARLQRTVRNEKIILGGACIAAPMLTGAALAVALDAPIPVILLFFFGTGCGVGSVSATGIATLQGRIPAASMGRINAAHQFIRTLGTTYGVGLSGAVLLSVVDRRIGSVEPVRELLGGGSLEDLGLGEGMGERLAEALQAGFAWSLGVLAAVMLMAIPSAIHLVRTPVEPVPSAPCRRSASVATKVAMPPRWWRRSCGPAQVARSGRCR